MVKNLLLDLILNCNDFVLIVKTYINQVFIFFILQRVTMVLLPIFSSTASDGYKVQEEYDPVGLAP